MKRSRGWKNDSYRHSLASKGIRTNVPKYNPKMPKKIYHGTDIVSWNDIQKVGFHSRPYKMARFTEPGYVYGTTEEGWAEVYAETRAKHLIEDWDLDSVKAVILEINLEGLEPEVDPTVALDVLTAYRVPLPIGPERVKVHKIIEVTKNDVEG